MIMAATVEMDMFVGEPVRRMTRAEYEQLAGDDFFGDQRVELLFGVVVEVSPAKPPHGESVYELHRCLERALRGRARVRPQLPFAADDHSEPEPDIAVVSDQAYWKNHPSRAFLIVEVAHTSQRRDRGLKARLYATTAVDEYWIVDVKEEVVEVYRDARDGEWQTKTTHRRGDVLAPRAVPDALVPVAEILPPLTGPAGES